MGNQSPVASGLRGPHIFPLLCWLGQRLWEASRKLTLYLRLGNWVVSSSQRYHRSRWVADNTEGKMGRHACAVKPARCFSFISLSQLLFLSFAMMSTAHNPHRFLQNIFAFRNRYWERKMQLYYSLSTALGGLGLNKSTVYIMVSFWSWPAALHVSVIWL